ncbi:MAG: hypothetical protein JWM56_1276 [Candidatus Peribacteria bacterium]|nr:hypothetical protein [Candidatus Peribacteria bacterium]
MDLHPHWDSAGTQEHASPKVSVPILPDTAEADMPLSAIHNTHASFAISRRPAAITGIAIALTLGLTYWHGWDMLSDIPLPSLSSITGQLFAGSSSSQAPAVHTIKISATGVDPQSLILSAGDTMTFVNATEIPHIIEIPELKGSDGAYITSPPIFPGSQEVIQIPAGTTPGLYTYTSSTDSSVTGQILIQSNAPATTPSATTPVSSAGGLPASSTVSSSFSSETVVLSGGISSSSEIGNTAADPLPQNPYTSGSDIQHPFDASGQPIASLFNSDGSLKTSTTGTLHSGAGPRPTKTTDSGPQAWIALLLSIGAFLWFSQSYKAVR